MTEPQPMDAPMEKFGCMAEDIRFQMEDWVLVAPPEGGDGVDAIHACKRKDKTGTHIGWSYQIPGDPQCPGCDATMPDEVQGLFAMANDGFSRYPTGWFKQDLDRQIRRVFADHMKAMFLDGSGKITGVTAP